MFADAEILKQAGGPRLVRVTAKGMSIKHYLPAGQHAAGECNRRRVQQDDVDCVGPEVMRRGKGRVEPAAIELGIRGDKNGQIDVAAWGQLIARRAAKQIGELDSRALALQRRSKCRESLSDIGRKAFVRRH